jgi:hypothetical protein
MDKVDKWFGGKFLSGVAESPREIIVESPEITLGVRDAKQIERQIEKPDEFLFGSALS